MMVKWNLLQMPKDPAFLYSFKARPGKKIVQIDLSAIEPRIMTEFSRDKNMMKLYGPNAKPNDIYLFNGANIELFSDTLRAYYDPDNPTPEGIAAAKANCKQIRQICKAIVLACGYGAGVAKVRSMLIALGFPVNWEEAEIIHRDYWKLYSGIKSFSARLEQMWRENGGYIINITGRPICLAPKAIKDIANRFVQSSGHDVLMLFLYHIEQVRIEHGVNMMPWIPDWHDETINECDEDEVPKVIEVYEEALVRVNEELGMDVTIEAEPQVADNLAEIKVDPEDYELFLEGLKAA